MKTLIAAVIASAVSFGAFAQSASAPAGKAPMAAGDSSMKHPSSSKKSTTAAAPKSSKSHTTAAKKPAKKASAPAA